MPSVVRGAHGHLDVVLPFPTHGWITTPKTRETILYWSTIRLTWKKGFQVGLNPQICITERNKHHKLEDAIAVKVSKLEIQPPIWTSASPYEGLSGIVTPCHSWIKEAIIPHIFSLKNLEPKLIRLLENFQNSFDYQTFIHNVGVDNPQTSLVFGSTNHLPLGHMVSNFSSVPCQRNLALMLSIVLWTPSLSRYNPCSIGLCSWDRN
jgi:hypothetical protein